MIRIHYIAICLVFGLLSGAVHTVAAQEDWNDIHVCSVGKVPPHTNVIPYANEGDIVFLRYMESPYYRSLNGTWKFRAVENPSACPKDFFTGQYRAAGLRHSGLYQYAQRVYLQPAVCTHGV